MKLSLCMITKNEENLIGQSLDSIKDYVDELIIVDTGSTDRTCEIALEYNATVYHCKWENDFSAARNFGIEKASGDWIIYLDADEVLRDGQLLRKVVNEAEQDIEAYLFHIVNYYDDEKAQFESSISARLFRNLPTNRFTGAVHEQLPLKDKYVAMTDLVIDHYGYLPSVVKNKNKEQRNLSILETSLMDNPHDPFLQFNLGSEYVRLKSYEKARIAFLKSLSLLKEETGYESRLFKLLGICLFNLNDIKEDIPIINQGIEKYPDYPDLYFIRGHLHEKEKSNFLAISDLLKCLSYRNQAVNSRYVLESGITGEKSYRALGRIFEKIGKKEKARLAYARAFQYSPNKNVLKKLKDYFSNLEELAIFFNNEVLKNKDAIYKFAEKMLDEGELELAIHSLTQIDDNSDKQNNLLGEGYYLQQQYEIAINYWEKLDNQQELFKAILPKLAASYFFTDKEKKIVELFGQQLSQHDYWKKAVTQTILTVSKKLLEKGVQIYPNSLKLQEQLKRLEMIKSRISSYF